MTIDIPCTFNTGNSEKYILSIRLRSGGLSFSGYIPSESGSFFYREANFERTTLSYTESLKEFFFQNEVLMASYKRINIICVSPQYTLIPAEAYDNKQADLFLKFNFSQPESKALTNNVKKYNLEVVYGIDDELHKFCSRTLLTPHFYNHITPLITYWEKQCLLINTRRMYVNLHEKIVDIICFDRGSLLFANSYLFDHPNDILYYILYVWKESGMDQLTDQLHIAGISEYKMRVSETLHTYVQHISQADLPSDVYLWGSETAQVPFDLITLLLCE